MPKNAKRDDDSDEKPAKGKDAGGKKKSNMLLPVGIAGGVLLLCCCGGTGGGVWWSWSSISGWFGGKTEVVAKGANEKGDDAQNKDGNKPGKVPDLKADFVLT